VSDEEPSFPTKPILGKVEADEPALDLGADAETPEN